jgi:hypothetical protein
VRHGLRLPVHQLGVAARRRAGEGSLRPEVQPGDSLQIKIVREGKEAEQGVGYLEDGTMVVVEDARQRIGDRLAVTVTGALQTPTGRMVFARCDRPAGRQGGKPVANGGQQPTGPG